MTIDRLVIIGIIVLLPTLLMINFKTHETKEAVFKEIQYQEAINKAIEDGAHVLNSTARREDGELVLDPEAAIDQYFRTLYENFNAYGSQREAEIRGYVPVVAILDIDGVYIYALEEKNVNGVNVLTHTLHEKQPFSIVDGSNNIVELRLDDTYKVYDLARDIIFEGTYQKLESINVSDFFNNTEEEINKIKQEKIISTIEDQCGYYINQHNTYAKHYGIQYDFYLPRIEEAEWSNTIKDVTMLSFIQGVPLGDMTNKSLNTFSVGGAGILEVQLIEGYEETPGNFVYHRESCPNKTGTLIEIFPSRIDAAKEGYYPCDDCK